MEQARVEIRNHRRDVAEEVKKGEKDGSVTSDESRRELELLQKVTDRWTAEVDRVGKHKETEIMEVG
jgi:ribosome recycling factor